MKTSPTIVTASTPLQDTINKYYPYLLEIRKRLLFVCALFSIVTIVGFMNYERIVRWCLHFFNLQGINVVFTSPFQYFTLAINSGIFVGLVVVFPLLLYQLLSFLRPALRPREFKVLAAGLPISILLFIGGFIFGVTVMKYVVTIFYQKSVELHIGNVLDIELLLSKIIMTGALMGLAFQFPIVLSVLMRFNIVKYKTIVAQRPMAYLIALVFVMLLPPTDLMSDAILLLPLVVLFELTLLTNRFIFKSHLR